MQVFSIETKSRKRIPWLDTSWIESQIHLSTFGINYSEVWYDLDNSFTKKLLVLLDLSNISESIFAELWVGFFKWTHWLLLCLLAKFNLGLLCITLCCGHLFLQLLAIIGKASNSLWSETFLKLDGKYSSKKKLLIVWFGW